MHSKSTESMSLPLSVMSAIATSSWVLYGILVADGFVAVSMVSTVCLCYVHLHVCTSPLILDYMLKIMHELSTIVVGMS